MKPNTFICLGVLIAVVVVGACKKRADGANPDTVKVIDPQRALTLTESEDICEASFKDYSKLRASKSDLIFLSMPGGVDPSDKFMERFRDYHPKAEKKSMALRDSDRGGQVRHKITGQTGVLICINGIQLQTNGGVRVGMEYDIFSLGGGNDSLVLSQSNAVWSVIETIPGVVY